MFDRVLNIKQKKKKKKKNKEYVMISMDMICLDWLREYKAFY